MTIIHDIHSNISHVLSPLMLNKETPTNKS